jgi:nucleotide-binding universal stress UspA family protein
MAEQRDKIIVPVDFEGASERAIEAARWLAGPLAADLVLLHVHDRPGFDHPELPDDMVVRIQGMVEQAAMKSLADLAAQTGVKQTVFRHGDAATQILAVARELKPRMVVMGTHGRSGLDRLLIGSVAAEVVRSSPVPVLTVRARGGEASQR